jgi:hypothetical protein
MLNKALEIIGFHEISSAFRLESDDGGVHFEFPEFESIAGFEMEKKHVYLIA